MFGHNHRCVWHFDLLDRVEFTGQSQIQTLNPVVLDSVVDRFVDTFVFLANLGPLFGLFMASLLAIERCRAGLLACQCRHGV